MVRYFKTKDQTKSWSDLIDYRKTHGRTQKLVDYEDKVKSKKIAAKSGCLVPKTYYVAKDPAKIPFSKLPDQYVVKPSHLAGSRAVFLMKNGIEQFSQKRLTTKEIIRRQQEYLTKQIHPRNMEWATGQIPRRVMVEEYVPQLSGNFGVPTDYKCYVFHGKVCMMRVDLNRRTPQQASAYLNRNFEIIDFDPIRTKWSRHSTQLEKPPHYDRMIEVAEKMGKRFGNTFIRIDMYITQDGPMFGEFTLYPGSGRGSKFTHRADKYMGALWKHPKLVTGEGQVPFTKEHFYKVLKLDENGQSRKSGRSTKDQSVSSGLISSRRTKNPPTDTDRDQQRHLIKKNRERQQKLIERKRKALEKKQAKELASRSHRRPSRKQSLKPKAGSTKKAESATAKKPPPVSEEDLQAQILSKLIDEAKQLKPDLLVSPKN